MAIATEDSKQLSSPLSSEFKVAAEIYRCTSMGENVWLSKLVSLLEGEVSKNSVSKALDILFDWGIIRAEYGATEKGRAARLYRVSNENEPLIREMYEKYWKEYRESVS